MQNLSPDHSQTFPELIWHALVRHSLESTHREATYQDKIGGDYSTLHMPAPAGQVSPLICGLMRSMHMHSQGGSRAHARHGLEAACWAFFVALAKMVVSEEKDFASLKLSSPVNLSLSGFPLVSP